ncbi:MAG TPA: hypothetical protein VGE62_03890 [Candidatus Paceibacterota bacterium]
MAKKKSRKWEVTISIEPALWCWPTKRNDTQDIPTGTYVCVERQVQTAAGEQTWLVINQGEYRGWGAWIEALKDKAGATILGFKEVVYIALKPIGDGHEAEVHAGGNGTVPPVASDPPEDKEASENTE